MNPVRMERVAIAAPIPALRSALVVVADTGSVELDEPATPERRSDGAARRLQRLAVRDAAPRLARAAPDLDRCVAEGRGDLLAGEADLERRADGAVRHGPVAALPGWAPASALDALAARLVPVGGAVVPMPRPVGAQPPTALTPTGPARQFAPLVEVYGTVPYEDVDPSLLAGLAYVLMFGVMFADVGEGALLLLAGISVRFGRPRRAARLQPVWLFIAGAGFAGMVFGALYGEFFGPTGVVPVLWLNPLENPIPLLGAAVAAGAVLLAGAYAVGIVNRFREGGWRRAVYAPSGIAGAALFLGLGAVTGGVLLSVGWLTAAGIVIAVTGLVIAFAGLVAAAGGGAAGIAQGIIELFDLVVRLASNLVSFARLAAFGLTHAAIGLVVWQAATALAADGPVGVLAAVVVMVVGTALAFGLEALVAAIQALRLEYYELFSRVFDDMGRPFRPWHIPLADPEAP